MISCIIVAILVWGLLASFFASFFASAFDDNYGCSGFEFLNPFWIYKHIQVNFIGTIFLTLFYNIICGPATICYWFYMLCTFGRV